MKVLGLQLRKLTSLSLTTAAGISVLIWMFFVGMLDNMPGGTDAYTAGASLIAIFWGTLCSALGINFRTPRELTFYAAGATFLLGAYHAVYFLYA